MTQGKNFKNRVREVAKEKGLKYTMARRLVIATDECEAFNKLYPVGTDVEYWKLDVGNPVGHYTGKTRTEAQVLSGHTAVVWIEGCVGCIALTHVRPLPLEGAADAAS